MDAITLPRSVVEQVLNWALNHGEKVYAAGGLKSIDSMNAWAEALRVALEQPDVRIPTSVPDGWKLVPVEPARDMLTTWIKAPVVSNTTAPGLYRAMLAAAPQPPTAEKSSGVEQPQVEQEPDAFREWWRMRPSLTRLQAWLIWKDEHKQPPRQPLTDEQIEDIDGGILKQGHSESHTGMLEFARAIERAHGIGGEA